MCHNFKRCYIFLPTLGDKTKSLLWPEEEYALLLLRCWMDNSIDLFSGGGWMRRLVGLEPPKNWILFRFLFLKFSIFLFLQHSNFSQSFTIFTWSSKETRRRILTRPPLELALKTPTFDIFRISVEEVVHRVFWVELEGVDSLADIHHG